MENNFSRPDAVAAADVLAGIEQDQRAVRDTPWPLWLYPVNSLLLVALGLSFLLPDGTTWVIPLVVALVLAANLLAGRINGVPFALPTSRTFLGLVALSGVLLVSCRVAADVSATLTVALALAAGATYAVASWVHIRSTRLGGGAR